MTGHTDPKTTMVTPVYLFFVATLCIALVASFAVIDHLFVATARQSLLRENGGVETASTVLHGVSVVVFFLIVPTRLWVRFFHLPVLFTLFAMRELDFDKAFTQSGILSLRFYSGDSPLLVKSIGAAFLLLTIFVLVRTVLRGFPGAWKAFREGELWPCFVVLAAVLIVFSKSVDGLARKMLGFGITVPESARTFFYVAEEMTEALLPICVILALVSRWKGRENQ